MQSLKKLTKLNFLFFIFLVGCGHLGPVGWNPQKNSVTTRAHLEILKELDENSGRHPSAIALNELRINFKDLRFIQPAKFEIYAFPKISSQVVKDATSDEVYLGPPKVFVMNILAVNPCREFIRNGLFSKYRPEEVFPSELSENKERTCAILEIENSALIRRGKGLLKQDDELVLRIFIDDLYKIHGQDHIKFRSRGDYRVVRRTSELENLNSGLSFFPIDLPVPTSETLLTNVSKFFESSLDEIALFQIKHKYSRNFARPFCEGAVFGHKDSFGKTVKVGWCKDTPWPTYTENDHFFSVTVPLKVRK